jgi:multidrug efflux pump subunit AcrB
VDDATVEIENIHRNRHLGKPLTVAILDGAHEIATPALVATLAICIVFFPVVLLTGPAQYLFTPMALSVVIAMMASYLLSRTLVPVLARMLMASEHMGEDADPHAGALTRAAHRFNDWRDRGFDRFTNGYGSLLNVLLIYRKTSLGIAGLAFAVTMLLIPVIGTDFFPTTDSGMMKLHFRAPSGTRIEETEKLVDRAETRIKNIIPPKELETINDMIGLPTSYNLAFVSTDNASGMDADILIQLKKGHKPTVEYMKKIRKDLNDHFPGCTVYFQSADIVSQVLNFGLSAPVDIQIEYPDYLKSYEYARTIRDDIKSIPGVEDVSIKQVVDYPAIDINVDRVRAARLGLTQRDVANSVLISLSSSSTVSPSFYINPTNNVNYPVAVQVPFQNINSIASLLSTPITVGTQSMVSHPSAMPTDVPVAQSQTLGNLATVKTAADFNQINHYTVQRVMNISANVEGHDLGSVSTAIQKKINKLGKLPPGMKISLRGQSEVMNSSFQTLGVGLILAIALVYLLMVVLFQSWLDPFIIMLALPGALMGILWMLTLTGTTINVVSLMGSIVAVGIAVSNSILMVSFANDIRVAKGLDSVEGALQAGKTRLRPVLMTAIAMVLGMIPMAIGGGEGGEQNAPLGRAVIGGLVVATIFTLFIVPIFYSVLRRGLPTSLGMDQRFEAEAKGAMATN